MIFKTEAGFAGHLCGCTLWPMINFSWAGVIHRSVLWITFVRAELFIAPFSVFEAPWAGCQPVLAMWSILIGLPPLPWRHAFQIRCDSCQCGFQWRLFQFGKTMNRSIWIETPSCPQQIIHHAPSSHLGASRGARGASGAPEAL